MQDSSHEPQATPGCEGARGSRWKALRATVEAPRFWRLAIVAILLLGASMRLTGVNWDEQTHLHPDERFLTDVTTRLGWPSSLGEYFDEARSPLNPHNQGYDMFVYGTLPIFIAKGVGILLNQGNYWQIHLVGRVLSAFYDLSVVVLVFFIGRRLYGRWVGLLASFLMACTVLNIQHSHFYTVETFTTLAVTLAFYFTLRAAQDGGWANWAATGACFGMAVAGKISVATFVLIIGLAALLRALSEPVPAAAAVVGGAPQGELITGVNGEREQAARRAALKRGLARAGLGLALAGVLAIVAFRVTQPYAFTGPSPFSLRISQRWLQQDVMSASKLVNGSIDFPPSHQWTDREPVWFAWRNMVLWGMGLPLGLAAWAGWLVAWVELVRRRRLKHLLVLVWVTLTFLYQSVQFVKSIRYFLPIYPLLVILAAYFVVWLWQRAGALAGRRSAGGSTPDGSPKARQMYRWAPLAAGLVGVVVVVGTFLYAEAFTNIYRRPLSRVAASRWVFENIPPGASVTWERWDDPIPQNVDGRDAGGTYRFIDTDPYWEDTPEKREAMLNWLDEADYIILSSNRVYDSVVRLPERFPLTIAYYRYLFSGELGFDILKVFTSYPNLGPIRFIDDTADEAFTVYDHPKVIILEKTPRYSSERARALLGDIEVERVMRLTPLDSMRSKHGLMLTPEEQAAQRAGGTWRAMFDPAGLANRLPALAWLAVLELLALIAFPFAFVAFRRFRDRGFIFAKTLGILGLAYLAWLGASLHVVPYTRAAIAGAALALLLPGAALAWRQRAELGAFLQRSWRRLLFEEALYLAFFGAFLLVRMGNPDLWHPIMGGEKPMDFAYLNAIIKSTWFPPYDPWFAGGYINYYYFGQVIVATLIKLSGVVPAVAYNLALPTLFALTAMGGYAVVEALLVGPREDGRVFDRAARFGLFGALLIAVLGNLGQVRLLLQGLWQASGVEFQSAIPGLEGLVKGVAGLYQVVVGGHPLGFRPEWWYWNASRVMGAGEINEFPFFSFLYADLHAHLIALPFGLLTLGLIVSLLRGRGEQASSEAAPSSVGGGIWARLRRWAAGVDWAEWLVLGLLALTLGELRVNNTWDYPTYLVLALAALVLAHVLRPEGVAWRALWRVAERGLTLVVASTLLFQPFHNRYGAAYTSLELWKGARTSLGDYVIIHGVFLLILTSYALSRVFGHQARGALARTLRMSVGRPWQVGRFGRLANLLVVPTASYQLGWFGVVALLGISGLSLLAGWWVPGLLLPLALVALALILRRDLPPAERFAALLFGLGLALTLAVEVVVLKGDVGRMNTVFKFYLQVWVLWGVAAAVALAVLSRRWARWPEPARRLWQAGLALVLLGAALYPLTATWGKINDRFDQAVGPTLDGTAYAERAVYHDQGQALDLGADMAALRWLQEHVEGSPVVLEGNTPLYRWGSRVSVYTGLPTVIGWDWHQRQQRAAVPADVVGWRLADVSTLYNGTERAAVERLLRLYDVAYVYVGQLEAAYYDPAGLAKFDAWPDLFRPVYRQGPVTIYAVRQESLGGLSARPFEVGQSATALTMEEQGAEALATNLTRSSDFSRLAVGRECGAAGQGAEAPTANLAGSSDFGRLGIGQRRDAAGGQGAEAPTANLAGSSDFGRLGIGQRRGVAAGQGAEALATNLACSSDLGRPGVGQGCGAAAGQGAEAPTASLAGSSDFGRLAVGQGRDVAAGQGAEALATNLAGGSDFGRPGAGQGRGAAEGQGAEAPITIDEVVDERGWNRLANSGPLAAAVTWWLALAVVGWTAWPLCLGACRGLPDRGYLAARALGWLVLGYGVWLGASNRLLANRTVHVYGALVLLVAAGAWAGYRQRRRLAALWRARRWLIVREELLLSGAFAALVAVRLLNPDLWQPWFGGEKMMELAYLNAIIKSAHFPPYDPYFAGATINYYYYGLYLVNVLVKLTGVVPEVAFNLAVPTFFALTVGLAFSFGHALTSRLRERRWLWGGLAAAVGVALLANLTVLVQWLGAMVSLGGGTPTPEAGLQALGPLLAGVGRWLGGQGALPPFDYWHRATRIIPYTINEFPFFSFLFADLHPHMMAIPFTITVLVLLAGRLPRVWAGTGLQSLVLLALVLGALGPMNTWDLPTYLSLAVVALAWLGAEEGRGWRGLLEALAVVALALLLYLPYYAHYAAPAAELRFLPARTGLRYYLVVWGLWLVALYGWLAPRCWQGRAGLGRMWRLRFGAGRRRARRLLAALGGRSPLRAWLRQLVGVAAVLAVALLLAGNATLALLLPLAALALDLWLRPDAGRAERLAGLVAAWGCFVLVGSELFYLADFLQGGEWQRMNTVFKFGIQAWVLLALAATVGVTTMWGRRGDLLHRWEVVGRRGVRAAWAVALVGLVAVSLAYVPLGTAARVRERFPGGPPPTGTLDGLAYMRTGVYHWPDEEHSIVLRHDYEAIHWLLENVRGAPVIAEAPLGYYREGGMRVSSYTGLPTLVGAHQNEQRPAGIVAERQELAERLYRSPDLQETLELLRRLGVEYVYFGQLEEIVYGKESRLKFDRLAGQGEMQAVYANPGVVIYRMGAG